MNGEAKNGNPKSHDRLVVQFEPTNTPALGASVDDAANGTRDTPPFKPWVEEKMWLALFWSRPLREFWRRELSERNWLILQKHIPQSWVLDPALARAHEVFVQEKRDLTIGVIRRGIARGEMSRDTDPVLIADLITGAVFQRVFITGLPVSKSYIDALVDQILS